MSKEARAILMVAWGLILVGATVLWMRYSGLPDHVPVYRSPWTGDAVTAPRSAVSVGRIVTMGLAQIGLTTAMAVSSQVSSAWLRFWLWASLAAGAKTLFECLGFAHSNRVADRLFTGATITSVALFLSMAAWWWSRGQLRTPPAVGMRSKRWLALWAAVWLVSAVWPRFASG